jgi:basic membrane protein A and related proteins
MLSSRRLSLVVFALLAIALVAAGCGKRGGGASGGDGGSGEGGGGPKVGLVTDLGGLNDRSFNTLANQGLEKAKTDLGVSGRVLESKSASDYESHLGSFAQEGFDLVFGVGFLMADPVKNVSAKATETNLAIIDFDYGEGEIPANVRGLLFKEQEAGYLAGALVGMVEQDGKLKGLNGAKVVSVVGGQKIPPVDRYVAGFQAGVAEYCKDCQVIVNYSQDFLDQGKCKEQALAQIGRGSDIIFQVAGGCGLGALDAAKTKGLWGVGVDADQSYLGPHILTSALKRVDVAVYDTIEAIKDGNFEGGTNATYGLKEDGVALGKIAPAATEYETKMAPVIEKIKAGQVEIPTEPK